MTDPTRQSKDRVIHHRLKSGATFGLSSEEFGLPGVFDKEGSWQQLLFKNMWRVVAWSCLVHQTLA